MESLAGDVDASHIMSVYGGGYMPKTAKLLGNEVKSVAATSFAEISREIGHKGAEYSAKGRHKQV